MGAGPTYLTEAGQALLPLCSSILAVAGEAVRALSDLRAAHSGRVALAASQTVGTYVVPRLLAAFRARNPGVRLSTRHWHQDFSFLIDSHGVNIASQVVFLWPTKNVVHKDALSLDCHVGDDAEREIICFRYMSLVATALSLGRS